MKALSGGGRPPAALVKRRASSPKKRRRNASIKSAGANFLTSTLPAIGGGAASALAALWLAKRANISPAVIAGGAAAAGALAGVMTPKGGALNSVANGVAGLGMGLTLLDLAQQKPTTKPATPQPGRQAGHPVTREELDDAVKQQLLAHHEQLVEQLREEQRNAVFVPPPMSPGGIGPRPAPPVLVTPPNRYTPPGYPSPPPGYPPPSFPGYSPPGYPSPSGGGWPPPGPGYSPSYPPSYPPGYPPSYPPSYPPPQSSPYPDPGTGAPMGGEYVPDSVYGGAEYDWTRRNADEVMTELAHEGRSVETYEVPDQVA